MLCPVALQASVVLARLLRPIGPHILSDVFFVASPSGPVCGAHLLAVVGAPLISVARDAELALVHGLSDGRWEELFERLHCVARFAEERRVIHWS